MRSDATNETKNGKLTSSQASPAAVRYSHQRASAVAYERIVFGDELLGHPQELEVLLDRADRKMIVADHRPGSLPVEHDTLHPHDR